MLIRAETKRLTWSCGWQGVSSMGGGSTSCVWHFLHARPAHPSPNATWPLQSGPTFLTQLSARPQWVSPCQIQWIRASPLILMLCSMWHGQPFPSWNSPRPWILLGDSHFHLPPISLNISSQRLFQAHSNLQGGKWWQWCYRKEVCGSKWSQRLVPWNQLVPHANSVCCGMELGGWWARHSQGCIRTLTRPLAYNNKCRQELKPVLASLSFLLPSEGSLWSRLCTQIICVSHAAPAQGLASSRYAFLIASS